MAREKYQKIDNTSCTLKRRRKKKHTSVFDWKDIIFSYQWQRQEIYTKDICLRSNIAFSWINYVPRGNRNRHRKNEVGKEPYTAHFVLDIVTKCIDKIFIPSLILKLVIAAPFFHKVHVAKNSITVDRQNPQLVNRSTNIAFLRFLLILPFFPIETFLHKSSSTLTHNSYKDKVSWKFHLMSN